MTSSIIVLILWRAVAVATARRLARKKGFFRRTFDLYSLIFTETTLAGVLLLPPVFETREKPVRHAYAMFLYHTPSMLVGGGAIAAALVLALGDLSDWDRLPSGIAACYSIAFLAVTARCVLRMKPQPASVFQPGTKNIRLTSEDLEAFDALWAQTKWPAHFGAQLFYVGTDDHGADLARLVLSHGEEAFLHVEVFRTTGRYSAIALTPEGQVVDRCDAMTVVQVVGDVMAKDTVLDLVLNSGPNSENIASNA